MTNWEKYTIGDLCEVGRGSSPRPIIDQRYFKGGTIPWIKIADATSSGKYIYETNEHVNEFGASFSRYLDKGSLIIAASGVSLGQIKFLGVKGCIHDGWLYTSNFKDELINKEFLYYFLIYYSEGFHNFSSGAAIQNINTDILRKTIIALPPISVQETIVSIISAYDDLIEVNNQRIKLLEETARELYKEWFVRMRFPGYKKAKFVKGVPEGWEVKRIAEVFDVLGGGTPSTEKPEYWSGNVNWFTPTDITGASGIFLSESSNKISEKGLKESSAKLFPAYSIMMTSRATIGAVGINTTPGCTNQGFITCLPNKSIPYTFLYFWILLNKEVFEMLGTGSTFLEITNGSFMKIKMLLPKLDMLNQFHKMSVPMFQQIEIFQEQNTQLRQIRDRLLPRLISGKLEVKN
ncbi:MAG: restriction endonuclease subunit S [Saprospiraceae bacterium]|nr:restriction endonuclease subunit S [Candidatus Vicinibacter affinis]